MTVFKYKNGQLIKVAGNGGGGSTNNDFDEVEKNFDLLWENSNPSVAQSSQSIPVANLSQYNTFVIKVQRAIDHTLTYNYSNQAITPEDNICFNTIGVFGYISYCRNVYVNLSSGELVINNGYVQSAIGSGAVNNDKLIVTHLYGLKTRLYTKLGELPDAELSATSENAVQNKAITNSVNTNMLGVPSNSNWVNISITADQTYGTAPANGWVLVRATSKNTNSWGTIYSYVGNTNPENRKVQSSCYNSLNDNFWSVCIPVKKGDTYKIHMSHTNFIDYSAHFVPAEEV